MSGTGFDSQAGLIHDQYLRRARSGALVRRDTHHRHLQGRHGNWRSAVPSLVPTQVITGFTLSYEFMYKLSDALYTCISLINIMNGLAVTVFLVEFSSSDINNHLCSIFNHTFQKDVSLVLGSLGKDLRE